MRSRFVLALLLSAVAVRVSAADDPFSLTSVVPARPGAATAPPRSVFVFVSGTLPNKDLLQDPNAWRLTVSDPATDPDGAKWIAVPIGTPQWNGRTVVELPIDSTVLP